VDLKQKLDQERNAYIHKYNRTPDIIFVSHSLYDELDAMVGHQNLYNAAPKQLWGANVIMVLTPGYVKFAEEVDIRKAVKIFHNDKSWDSYKVAKTETTIGSVGGVSNTPAKVIELEPIEFSREEIEIYITQN